MHDFYQNLPLNIDPIAFSIGSFSVRWYSISFVIGFLVVYLVLMWRIRRENFNFGIQYTKYNIQSTVLDFLLVSFFSALIGGRIGYVIFYDLQYFLANPLAIISPYDSQGSFVGIFGMSYHGALLGILLGNWIFLKRKKINFLLWADFVAPAVALGYFLGRLGNFFNGELYGRITNSSWGMYFQSDSDILRHPSQLYEAFLEGLILFVILWIFKSANWSRKMPKGFLFAIYLVGYGILRIFAEQFRQPDPQIGILLGHFTLGQLLSAVMIFGGVAILFGGFKKRKRML